MPESLASSGDADAFTGEPAGDDVDGFAVGSDVSDVTVDGDTWEPLLEQAGSELVFFAEPAVVKASEVESVGEQSASIE